MITPEIGNVKPADECTTMSVLETESFLTTGVFLQQEG